MAVARTFALGVEKATGLVPGGFDVMRVDFNENQASNLIYGAGSRHVTGYAYPTAGGAVCTSLGMSQALDCGFVGQTSVTYTLYADDGRFIQTVYGGTSTGLNVVPGDSGSPIHSPRHRDRHSHRRLERCFRVDNVLRSRVQCPRCLGMADLHMSPLGRLLLIASASLVLLTGCGSIGPRPSTGVDSNSPTPTSDLTIRDPDGYVAEVVGVAPIPHNPDRLIVQAVEGSPTEILLSWAGPICNDSTELSFGRSGAGLSIVLAIHQTTKVGLVCPAVAVANTIRVRFTRPVAPSLIRASVWHPDPRALASGS